MSQKKADDPGRCGDIPGLDPASTVGLNEQNGIISTETLPTTNPQISWSFVENAITQAHPLSHVLLLPPGVKPYYLDEKAGIAIICGDCREVLPGLRADLLLTDPPYGHGERWSGGTWGADPIYALDAKRWDAAPVDAERLRLCVAAAPRSIIWGGNYFSLPPSRCWLAWEKSSKMATLADFELAWTSLDRPSKMYREDRNPDGKRYHPTQKPLNLLVWCLQFAPDARIVLDAFAGSGSTLVAAKSQGRSAIGIEIEEKYCEIAARRLSQSVFEFPNEIADNRLVQDAKQGSGIQSSLLEEMGRIEHASKTEDL